MPTLLKIGADVTGAEKVERLARDLREAANATDSLAKSSQKGSTEFKNMSAVMGGTAREAEKLVGSISQTKAVLAGFKTSLDSIWSSSSVNAGLKEFQTSIKEVGRDLSYSRQQLSDFITTSGQYATLAQANAKATHATSVALRAEEAAMNSLLRIEGNYVAAKAKELLLTDKAAIALTAETAAVNAQISAYQKLNASGKMGNYEKGFDYVATLKAENASIAAQERGLATLAQQFSALKAVRSTLKQGSYAAEIAAENASIAAQERGLKELEAQFRKTAAARAALKQGSYTVSDYAQSGRDKLAAGSVAGGYDYAEQLKKESILYDEVSGKAKNYHPILTKLGQAWDDAGKKSSVFHNLMRGASGAMGTLWLTYGQMIPMIAGFATVAATIKTVQLGAEFDDIARKISFLETSAGGAAITTEQLKNQLQAIGNSPQSLTEQAEGLLEFARAGVSAAEALKPIQQEGGTTTTMLEQLSAMAYYSGTKLQDITAQVQKFASAYNTDVITTANVVAKIADISQASIPTMMRAFENATSQNVLFGSSIEEVAAVLGVMHDKGIDAAKAGAALTTAMTKLVNPTKKVEEQFHQLGFSAIDATTGKTKDLVTMFGDLQKAADKLPASMRAAFLEDSGGLRGLKAIAPGIASAEQALTDFNKTIGDYKNKVEEAGGEGGKQFTYLQQVIESLGESGKYNLDLLVASVKDLFVTSYDNASSVRMMQELRNVVTAQDTKDSLNFIVDKILWLTTAAAKTINFTIKILDSTDADTNRKLALIGGLVGARLGGVKGAALGSTVATIGGGALLDALGINDKSLGELDAAKTKVKELQEALTYQQTSAQAASNSITKAYHNYKIDDVTKQLQAEREIVAELEKTAAAQNNVAQATGKTAGAVGKLTEAQIAAGDEALKSLDYYTKQSSLVGKSEVEKVQARISETIADQKKKLDAAGMSAEEYNKVLSESEEVIKKSFGPELEAAKKKDLALTADQIVANRAATAGRRAEAAANKLNREALAEVNAEIKLYIDAAKDADKEADRWVKSALDSVASMKQLAKEYATVGMSSDEKYYYDQAEAIKEANDELATYFSNLESAEGQYAETAKAYNDILVQIDATKTKLANNPLLKSEDQENAKLIELVNQRDNLVVKMREELGASVQLRAEYESVTATIEKMNYAMRDKTPYEAMQKGMKEAVYSGKEMAEDIQRATENAFDSMTDAIVDFVKTGKMNFSDLTDSILADLLTIMVRANITNTILSAMGMSSYTGLAGGTATSASGAAAASGMNVGGLGGLFNSGSTIAGGGASLLSGWGADLAFSDSAFSGLSSTLFDVSDLLSQNLTVGSGILAGVGSLSLSLFSGGGINAQSASQAGGAALGTMLTAGSPIGGVLGGIVGSLVGGMFGTGVDTFGPQYMANDVGVNYSLESGMTPTTIQYTGGDTDSQIAKVYAEQMRSIQTAFDDQVTALADALPDEISSAMLQSLSSANLKQILNNVSGQEINVSDAASWMEGVAEAYSEGLIAELGKAYGTALSSFISTNGAEGLVGSSEVWGMLTDAVKSNIETTFQEAAATIAAGDIETGVADISSITSAIAAIGTAMEPIQEIIDTNGLSDYELSLRSINNQFIAYEASLKAAGVDLVKYADFYKAWDISVAKINAEEKAQLLDTTTSNILSELDDIASAASNALDEAESALNSAYEAEISNLDKVHEKTIANLNERLSLLTEEHSALSSLKSSLTSGISSLGYGEKATVPTDLADAMSAMYKAVEAAGAGDFSVATSDSVDTAISTLSSITTDGYSSIVDFQRDSLKAYAVMDSMRTLAGDQIDADDKQIRLLEDQISAENIWYEAETSLLQKQLEALLGVQEALSINQATANYQAASVASTTAAAAVTNITTGNGIKEYEYYRLKAQQLSKSKYQGDSNWTVPEVWKAFDEAGLSAYEHWLLYGKAEGLPMPSFASGTDYVPQDMTAQIHQGERITPAAYNRSDATNAELLVELKSLREAVTELSYIASTSNDATIKTSKTLNRIEAIGVLIRSEA